MVWLILTAFFAGVAATAGLLSWVHAARVTDVENANAFLRGELERLQAENYLMRCRICGCFSEWRCPNYEKEA